VVNNLNDEAFILRNNTVEKFKRKANYIRIKLVGKEGNTMALGAKVELWSKGNYQFAEHFLSRGYASSVDPVVHFGLSEEVLIDSIKVTWPASGNTTLLTHTASNQIIEIDEMNSRPAVSLIKSPDTNHMLFSRSDSVIDYLHEQTDFIDFFYYQMIIPHKFSQIGPVMAKGDLNNDGLDDLIIGSTNMLPTTVLLRSGEGFKKSEFAGLTTRKEFVESDLSVVDIDGDGDNDIVAVAGGYENPDDSEYHHYLYENRNDSFIRTGLPIPTFPASVVRPFDFDHDGDMDVFVGSRVKKGKFPFADHSWLLINQKGRLSVNPFSGLDLGMVTDAVWSDYNQDGWEDLLVAREWNSITILRNMNGKELVLQDLPETRDYHGIWYSLCAGDFDRDGDDDYIAGNLGDNHRFTVTDRYPLNLYAVDLDLDGKIDPLTTAFWKDQYEKMKEYPVNYLDELSAQTAFFKRSFTDYTSFSFTGIDDILDDDILKRLELKLYVNTTSSYIIWNEKGKFRWEKLPVPVQLSPVKKMLVRDFNADGYPDVLAAGNDYTYDIATGYYDANKGLVLLSKGNRKLFEVLTPAQSGILLRGMTESLQYFEGESPLVVSGINRARIEVFKHLLKE